MSNFNLGFHLPFTFEVKDDGTIHDTDNQAFVFPDYPNRQIWSKKHPHIAYAPKAMQKAMEIAWEETGIPQNLKGLQKICKREGLKRKTGDFTKGGMSGNLTKAFDAGLIGRLTVKSYNVSRKNKTTSEFLYVPIYMEQVFNQLSANIANWIDSPNEITNMDLLKYLEDFCRTAKAKGLDSLKTIKTEKGLERIAKKKLKKYRRSPFGNLNEGLPF